MRLFVPLAFAALLVAAVSAAPPAAAGPCDNEIERIVCAVLEAINPPPTGWIGESIRHLCDHWQICIVDQLLP